MYENKKKKRKMKRAGRKESKQAKTRAEEEDEYDGLRRVKKAFISSFGSTFSHQNWLN